MNSKKHILVVSQYFYPEQFRINDICQELYKRGYKVTVLTGIPNYPEGKFYNGYGLLKNRKETWNGIDIIRIPLVSRGNSKIRLILNYYSFVISGFIWNIFTKIKADLVFTFEVSPMTQALVGVWYSKLRKVPHYLYVQDLWPDNLEVVGGIHNEFILNHYAKMSKRIYESCTKVFATSPSFVETIKSRIDDNKDKVKYLPQYAEDFYKPLPKKGIKEIPNDDRLKIVFTGNIGVAQGLDILPEVADELKKDKEKVVFVIVGNGRYKEELIKQVINKNVEDMFIFIDRQPAERIPDILAACDIGFLSFQKNALWKKTIPAKLQSYMACGMPILAIASGETKRIINEARCGICNEDSDIKEVVDSIRNMKIVDLSVLSNNSEKYSKSFFNKKSSINILINTFEEQ